MMLAAQVNGTAIVARTLPGTECLDASSLPPRSLARADVEAGRIAIRYRSEVLAREYLVDDDAFDNLLAGQSEGARIRALRLLARTRLVNSRNRLTHAVLSTVLHEQAPFVRSGDPVDLQPLAQKRVVEILAGATLPDHHPRADASRVSRVLRAGSVVVAGDKEVDLGCLCPTPRSVHGEIVRDLVRREQARMVASEISAPLTDAELARDVSRRLSVPVSRRAVAFIRKDLGIPDYRERARRGCYLTATSSFSALRPAEVGVIRVEAPRAPGVYEIRTAPPGPLYPAGHCPTVYLGSTNNLRKRILDQLRGNGRNARLAERLGSGDAQIRWVVVRDGWRREERRIYEQFLETFGAPPDCNRMSP